MLEAIEIVCLVDWSTGILRYFILNDDNVFSITKHTCSYEISFAHVNDCRVVMLTLIAFLLAHHFKLFRVAVNGLVS